MRLTLTMVNLIVALSSSSQMDTQYNTLTKTQSIPLVHFLWFMAVVFSLSITIAGCSSEPDIEPSVTQETVVDIGEPLAPDHGTATEATGKGILHFNDGIETLDKFLDRHPNVKVRTGPQRNEITLKDGSKIRGEMIDINDAGSVILKLDSGKQITIPSSDYTSIRLLPDKKGGS